MADEFVYRTAWKATILTAGVVIAGLVAAVVVAGMRHRATHAVRRRYAAPSPDRPADGHQVGRPTGVS